MNNITQTKVYPVLRLSTLLCSIFLLSACAGNSIVKLEDSVEQLKDLNDHDRDGVIEARDKCADTVLGAIIDNYGCGTQTSYVEPHKVDIKFAHNSYVLSASALTKIQEMADFLVKNEQLKVLIEGHTSKVGGLQLNQTLSDNRAKTVVDMLTDEFNIAPERVSFKGYGFERLADFADNEAAHAANRRIVAELSQTVNTDNMMWTIYTVDEIQ
ncbi:OmpA family protein [uncultured Paraglaciecola sp.]|uniref:OmpA family protein n=1 Tax=uncultured Paraglaciecola sp. TaxID=1765024 RepID=UPI002610C389|nr:OmpA family protein [uncultured Paraglaciecola sp.]